MIPEAGGAHDHACADNLADQTTLQTTAMLTLLQQFLAGPCESVVVLKTANVAGTRCSVTPRPVNKNNASASKQEPTHN